jgi:predicted transcriptional regulator
MVLTFMVSAKTPKIFIVNLEQEDELETFCSTLQILTKRDRDKTVITIIRSLLHSQPSEPISSSKLAKAISLNRVTVIHHLSRLEKIGLLKKHKGKYFLTEHGFSRLVIQAKEESDKIFQKLLEIANKLDQKYLLKGE